MHAAEPTADLCFAMRRLQQDNDASERLSAGRSGTEADSLEIRNPGPNDVLFGRGTGSNMHPGNIRFRALIKKYKPIYRDTAKKLKPSVSSKVVEIWRDQVPPGRFLMRTDDGHGPLKVFYSVSDVMARRKCAQALREKSLAERNETEQKRNSEDQDHEDQIEHHHDEISEDGTNDMGSFSGAHKEPESPGSLKRKRKGCEKRGSLVSSTLDLSDISSNALDNNISEDQFPSSVQLAMPPLLSVDLDYANTTGQASTTSGGFVLPGLGLVDSDGVLTPPGCRSPDSSSPPIAPEIQFPELYARKLAMLERIRNSVPTAAALTDIVFD